MYIDGRSCTRCGRPIWSTSAINYDGLCERCRNLQVWKKYNNTWISPPPDDFEMPEQTGPMCPDGASPAVPLCPCANCKAIGVLKELLEKKEAELRQLKEDFISHLKCGLKQ